MEDRKFERHAAALKQYIEQNARLTLKPPNAYLNHPFVDPGSIYDGNLWDWDSFWAVYALFCLAEDDADDGRRNLYIRHAKGNIDNFMEHQLDDGYIPMMINNSGLPEPYLNIKHKEGVIMNMHKPFLCQQIALIGGFSGDGEWAAGHIDRLEKYFACYDRYYRHPPTGLYVWADDIMIGVDNDPATFGRPKFSTANIYLNAFMVSELKAMAKICADAGRGELAAKYAARADELAGKVIGECWDRRDKFFYSVDVDVKTRQFDWFHKGLGVFWKTLPIKIRVWSGFIPLWSGIATADQAAYLAKTHYADRSTFNSPFGVATLAQDEKMFDVSATNNPSNWLGPIWIVANYVVFRGLMNYGFREEAEELCRNTVRLLGEDLEKTGTLHEYYVPSTGEPVMNGGFLNWNMLVVNMIEELKGKPPMCRYWL
jgi:Neutral trehalase